MFTFEYTCKKTTVHISNVNELLAKKPFCDYGSIKKTQGRTVILALAIRTRCRISREPAIA